MQNKICGTCKKERDNTNVCPHCGQHYCKKCGIPSGSYDLCPWHYQKPAKTCPACRKGTIVEKNGKYGPFRGCTNYPRCTYTEN